VVDDRTRECLALVADTSISGARVADARSLRRIAKGFCAEPIGALQAKPLCAHRPSGQYEPPSFLQCWMKVGGAGSAISWSREQENAQDAFFPLQVVIN
jgi:hypothetical protein